MKALVSKKHFLFLLGWIFLQWGTACSGENAQTGRGELYPVKVGAKTLHVEACITEIEHRRGLMNRASLAETHGMLFIFPKPNQLRFWMKNTPLPLDIGFFNSEGVLQEIYPLQPNDLTTVESKHHDLQFALEVNRDWFKNHGVRVGDKIDLDQVKDILEDRNLAPSLFGLR